MTQPSSSKAVKSGTDANGWMDITTAPKDGTEVLVYVDDHRPPDQRVCVAWFEARKDGTARWLVFATDDAIYSLEQPLTHWQPVPKPPVNAPPPIDGED